MLERVEDELGLVYLKEFPLDIPYTAVIGTVRRLKDAYRFTAGYLDQTGVGEGPYEEQSNSRRLSPFGSHHFPKR